MSAIFKGTTEDCITHLRDAIKDDFLTKRHAIASFVGVEDSSVRRWFGGTNRPVGESLVRLRFYLEFLGYSVVEIQPLAPVVRDAARVYAFGILSLEEMAPAVGYAEGRKGCDCLLRVFRGDGGISSGKADLFASIVDRYGDQLAERKKTTQKIVLGNGGCPVETPESSRPAPLPVRLASRQELGAHEAFIESLAGSVKAMIPLAREISSDRFTPEERARVRELAGGDGVFTLANILYRLCGERSRSMRS